MFCSETGIEIKPGWLQILHIAEALLDLMVLLSPPLLYWHDRCASSHPVSVVLGIEPQLYACYAVILLQATAPANA